MKKEIKLMAEKEVSKILSNYVLGNKHPHIEYDFNENIFYINFEDCWLFFEEMFLLGYDDIRNVFETGIKKHFKRKINDLTVKIKNENITHKIRTLNDAINVLGKNDVEVINYKIIKNTKISQHLKSYLELVIITKALNEGWEPDWNNSNQKKWYNWFKYDSSTSRFVFHATYYVGWSANTHGSSRLCYREKSLAAFAANRFPQIYNDYLNSNK
jgi:hypothetical protein